MTQPTQTKAKVERNGALAIVRLDGDITSASREAVLGTYEGLPADVRGVAMDFGKVPYLNSSGIALVIQLVMEANKAGRKVAVFGLTPHFQKVFTMVGLAKYTTLHPDEAGAVRSFGD
jgi:anti-sigma B factor antagonist